MRENYPNESIEKICIWVYKWQRLWNEGFEIFFNKNNILVKVGKTGSNCNMVCNF